MIDTEVITTSTEVFVNTSASNSDLSNNQGPELSVQSEVSNIETYVNNEAIDSTTINEVEKSVENCKDISDKHSDNINNKSVECNISGEVVKVVESNSKEFSSESVNPTFLSVNIETSNCNAGEENDDLIISTKISDNQSALRNKKKLTIFDSDSEEDANNSGKDEKEQDNESEKENFTSNDNLIQKRKSKLFQLCDSSDEENATETQEKVRVEEKIHENTYENFLKNDVATRLKTLCDSESSADENEHTSEEFPSDNPVEETKSKKKILEPTEKRMTGKEAQEQRKQIKSESQRMVRESRVYLPYHRPKTHSLQDFLKRRSRLNEVIKTPPNTPTTFAIKMSLEQLTVTAERLKKREEEIEKFYKSDSDSEPENPNKTNDENAIKKPKIATIENETNKNISGESESEKTGVECRNTKGQIQEGPEKEMLNKEINTEENEESSEKFVLGSVEKSQEKNLNNKTEILQNEENFNDSHERIEIDEEKIRELRDVLEKYLPCHAENTEEENQIETEKPASEVEAKENEDGKKSAAAKIEEKLKKLNPLISLKVNFQPRLSGSSDDFIVLDEGLEKSKGVNNLMQRFLTHTAKNSSHKKAEMSILKMEGGVLQHETIIIEEEEEEPAKKFQIPGAKFKKLKEELEEQIAKKRMEEMKKRLEEKKLDNEEEQIYQGEKMDCGSFDDAVLDNDEEEELTDSESSSESEEEEIYVPEKPRKKSAFVDVEAEESEDAEDLDAEENNEDESGDNSDEQSEEEKSVEAESSNKKSKNRRIISAFVDDSDEESRNAADSKITTSTKNTQNNMWDENDDNDDDEDEIPLYQPRREEKTPCKSSPQQKQDITALLSPAFHLTALQRSESSAKNQLESPRSSLSLPPEPSPLKSHSEVKTNLFGLPPTKQGGDDPSLDELENLCSGRFTGVETLEKTQRDIFTAEKTQESDFNFFAGGFSGSTKELFNRNDDKHLTQGKFQDFSDSQNGFSELTQEKEPEDGNTAERDKVKNNESSGYKFVIVSSSDEEVPDSQRKRQKTLKKKRKYIIDDISITDEEVEYSEDEEADNSKDNAQIDYDSEENEIELDCAENVVAKEFFENEAELSESDWDSADEDEKGLDDFEVEEGDEEKINERKMQRELERMHVRQVLDEDKREVRLLQELLLEDGELHGAGRERKFRWKNADSVSWNDSDRPKEEDEDYEEAESELQWRKMRHERETFLKQQQMKKLNEEDDLVAFNDSQFMKLGEKAVRKTLSGAQETQQITLTKSPEVKIPFSLANKRGSFLARSETTLARLAEITRSTGATLNSGPKNSRNFVFTSIEKTEVVSEVTEKKRKAEKATPRVLKKLRIADMSPSVQNYKKKLPIT